MKTLLPLLLFPLALRAAEIKEQPVLHAGLRFRVVLVDPADLQLVWKNSAGQPYRTFDKVQAAYAQKGKTVRFLMNAGIFEPGGIPSGVHIENSEKILPANPDDGAGNFFLKPNGIVCLWKTDPPTASISTVPDWTKNTESAAPLWANQSGPLLLINGTRHPAFKKGSENKLHRNGVGIDKSGRFVFAITDRGQWTNFWDFAGLFLQLGCQNALFLDGDISQMAVNPEKPIESNQFGAMFIVTK